MNRQIANPFDTFPGNVFLMNFIYNLLVYSLSLTFRTLSSCPCCAHTQTPCFASGDSIRRTSDRRGDKPE